MKPCSLAGADCPVCAREPNQTEMLIVTSPETKVTSCGGGGTLPAASPSPDLLNDLHTLRSLAHAVKTQADAQRLWSIAARCATISEDCTLAIEHFNAVNESHEQTRSVG